MIRTPRRGQRVQWEYLPGRYHAGTVVDVDGTVGVKPDHTVGVVYIGREALEEIR